MEFSEHVKIREEKFGSVIFDTLREKVFVTNESGKEILNLLRKGHLREEIVSILKDNYGRTEATQIKDDVTDFINKLKDNNVIEL